MTASERISKAWEIAAADLGIGFVTPFELEDGGRIIRYVGLVPDFGSDKGMLIFVSADWEPEPWAKVAKKNGFGYSCVGSTYESYDREEFIAALDDWQWTPKDRKAPAWYTGMPWGK
jgi:hypothetical protein